MWRELFSYSLNPEVFFDAENLRNVTNINQSDAGETNGRRNIVETQRLAEARWSSLAARITDDQRALASTFLMEQSAPMATTLGATVHSLSAPGVFELPEQLSAMALLADDVGAGNAHRGRADAFRNIAQRYGAGLATMPPHEFSQDRWINEQMFRLPGTLLAFSRRSDEFKSELIGCDLALRELGLLSAWSFAAKALNSKEWIRLDMAVEQTPGSLPEDKTPLAVSRAIAQKLTHDESQKKKVNFGSELFLALYDQWDQMLHDLTIASLDPQLSMALLLQNKSRVASAYHKSYKLEGQTLQDWFNEAQNSPLPLLEALGRSRLIRKGEPNCSRLTNQLLDFGGPMFRIFSDNEVVVIRNWISDLDKDDTWFLSESRAEVLERLSSAFVAPRSAIGKGEHTLGIKPSNIRQAYFTLQGRALAPTTQCFAADYCDFWLAKAEKCIDKSERSLPARWQPGLMREWLLGAHDRHAERFEESTDSEIPSRETVIEQSLQLAPLTLIDGAWLQGYTDVTLASSRIGAPLFNTYWDELGNGNWEINHPKVYRDVLAEMGKNLPPTASIDFAFHPDLNNESFRLPVFWLAIGKFPLRYRAEILGLNLAMELSGVGGTYRNAQRFLKHHKLPTIFVDLHNTIDNVSDGHSAWAADAIDIYISGLVDPNEASLAWDCVRKGFEALDPITSICGPLDYFHSGTKQPNHTITAAEALHHAQ